MKNQNIIQKEKKIILNYEPVSNKITLTCEEIQ